MEREPQEPDDENVSYMDEYPEAAKRVWLRRLNRDRQLGRSAITPITRVYQLPIVTEIPRKNPDDPDGAA